MSIGRSHREQLIDMAIESLRSSPRSGQPLRALSLPDDVLRNITDSSIAMRETDEQIIERIKPVRIKHKVSPSSVNAYLRKIRKEYAALNRLRAKSLVDFDRIMDRFDRDPAARARIIIEVFSRRIFSTIIEDDGEPLNDDPEQLRELTRMIECVVSAAEIDSRIAVSRGRLAKLRAEIDKLDRDADGGATKGDVRHMISAFMDAVGRGDLLASDPSSKAKSAGGKS